MIDEALKKEVIEKFIKHLDNSYILISIENLREIIPELYKLVCLEPKKEKLLQQPPLKPPYKKIVEDDEIITIVELEKRLIHAALEKTNGNVEKTAIELGISERNLYRKLNDYGVDHNKYKKKC